MEQLYIEEVLPHEPFSQETPYILPPPDYKQYAVHPPLIRIQWQDRIGYPLRSKVFQFKGKRALKYLFDEFSSREILQLDPNDLVEFLNFPELLLAVCRERGYPGYLIFTRIWNAALGLENAPLEQTEVPRSRSRSRSPSPRLHSLPHVSPAYSAS